MENASKALIMSGAVLIAIVLISIGVYIISTQKGTIDSSKRLSDLTAIQTENGSFTKYTGKQKGSVVRDLLNTVQTNNNSSDKKSTITIKYSSIEGSDIDKINEIKNKINVAKYYNVEVKDYDDNGYVTKILINDP